MELPDEWMSLNRRLPDAVIDVGGIIQIFIKYIYTDYDSRSFREYGGQPIGRT